MNTKRRDSKSMRHRQFHVREKASHVAERHHAAKPAVAEFRVRVDFREPGVSYAARLA
jgi:hypothetical protein